MTTSKREEKKECTCKIGQEIFPDGVDMMCPIHGESANQDE